ncbi:unnamed protein product [Coregonus sp. 'balchen']|nr:unnamed protein product [Coregonus sp. 'balchen']
MCQLMGLAVYNSIGLDIHFPPYCYKKLLTPHIAVLAVPLEILDLAHGLGELFSYAGNVEEDFYLTFQVWTISAPIYYLCKGNSAPGVQFRPELSMC